MIEKQIIIDIEEYEELKELAEAGYDATKAVERVLESRNPNEECRTITFYKDLSKDKFNLTRISICTNDELLKDMEESYQKEVNSITESKNYWEDLCWKDRENYKTKIEEYNNLPFWKRLFKKIEL